MKHGEIVIVTLRDPREQFWGQLRNLDAAGVTIRGLDVRNFEEWSREIAGKAPVQLGPEKLFYPMHRVERISADEQIGAVPSIKSRFEEITGQKAAACFKG
jgi:hypothetical protein